jgi:superfamily II DNA/RNA helicase
MAIPSNFFRRKSTESRGGAVRFEVRPYQVKAANTSVLRLLRGRNVVVDLPTGAGKTNIAFMAACHVALSRGSTRRRVLYVVPTRTLVEQVVHAAQWLHPDLLRVGINPKLAANHFSLNAAIERAHIIVSTPGLLANLLHSGAISRDAFTRQLAFSVIDEFDEFLTIDATHTGFAARYEKEFERLRENIAHRPLLLMSGTAPRKAATVVHSFTADLLAQFVLLHH